MDTQDLVSTTKEEPKITRLAELLPSWNELAETRHEAYETNTIHGPDLASFPVLARNLGGTLSPGFHVLHGEPGTGKTALALQIAAECGITALYVTAEMSIVELLARIVARSTKTALSVIKSGRLTPDEMNDLARRAVASAPHLAFVDATLVPVCPEWLTKAASGLKGDAKQFLLVVDSVHSWAEGYRRSGANEYDFLNGAIADLRKLAQQLDCPVVGIAERNRASMEKGGMAASAGTRKFEYTADTVLDLSRQEDGPDEEVTVTVAIRKNRNGGASGHTTLLFDGSHQQFMEL